MKEEYLWSREGNDADVERLEDLLGSFRYQPTAAPAIAKAKRAVWKSWLIPAFTLTAAAVLIAAWTFRTTSVVPPVAAPDVAVNNVTDIPVQRPIISEPTAGPVAEKPTFIRTVFFRNSRPRSRNTRANKKPPVVLTAEERHAYNQVVLALLITGSKLRSVHDTIDRMENNDAKLR